MDDKQKAKIVAETQQAIREAVTRQLVTAVREGRIDAFAGLVQAWADPDTAVEGRSLLCFVIAAATPMPFDDAGNVVRALVKAGADINAAGPDGMTPLLTALMGDDEALVKTVLECGADANAHPAAKTSPLYLAVEGDLAGSKETMTRLLVAHGADPDRAIAALRAQGADTVRKLLQKTAEEKQTLTATGIVSMRDFADHAARLLALLPAPIATRQEKLWQKSTASGARYKLPKGPA